MNYEVKIFFTLFINGRRYTSPPCLLFHFSVRPKPNIRPKVSANLPNIRPSQKVWKIDQNLWFFGLHLKFITFSANYFGISLEFAIKIARKYDKEIFALFW